MSRSIVVGVLQSQKTKDLRSRRVTLGLHHLLCLKRGPGEGGGGETDGQTDKLKQRQLVSWCFKPNQPQRIISGLKQTFIKRHIAQGTNTAEIKAEEQSENSESCRENLWNEIQLKGP